MTDRPTDDRRTERIITSNDYDPYKKISHLLQSRMTRDIMPVLLAYLGCGVILAILQIIAIVLSSAYSAALARRGRREEERYAAVKQGY